MLAKGPSGCNRKAPQYLKPAAPTAGFVISGGDVTSFRGHIGAIYAVIRTRPVYPSRTSFYLPLSYFARLDLLASLLPYVPQSLVRVLHLRRLVPTHGR